MVFDVNSSIGIFSAHKIQTGMYLSVQARLPKGSQLPDGLQELAIAAYQGCQRGPGSKRQAAQLMGKVLAAVIVQAGQLSHLQQFTSHSLHSSGVDMCDQT